MLEDEKKSSERTILDIKKRLLKAKIEAVREIRVTMREWLSHFMGRDIWYYKNNDHEQKKGDDWVLTASGGTPNSIEQIKLEWGRNQRDDRTSQSLWSAMHSEIRFQWSWKRKEQNLKSQRPRTPLPEIDNSDSREGAGSRFFIQI